ncbi:C40 family peptidase, partial [Agrilactobacillus composti]
GTIWYNVGADQFVNDTEVSESVKSVTPKEGTVTITTADKAVLQHSVNGRTIDGRDPLEVGSQWHYTEVAVDAWNQNNYDLGDNQWVQGAYTDDPEGSSGKRAAFLQKAIDLGTGRGYSESSNLRNGPDYYDCSGLVWASLQQFGIDIGDVSWDQFSATTAIDASEAVPGDLVFYGPTGHDHVGIFSGNGQMWNAENTQDGIGYSPTDGQYWTSEPQFHRVTQLG